MTEVSITARIAALQEMTVAGLQAEYQELFAKATKNRNKKQLFRQLAKKIQDNAVETKAGNGVAKPTLVVQFERKSNAKRSGKAKKAGKEKRTKLRPAGQRDPRLPKPGTTITREWHGKKYLVRVLDDGFEYDGKPFRSLSGLARHITGQIINGFLFFDLLPKVADPANGGKGKKS